MPSAFRIRAGRAEDAPALARIYWRAGARFAASPHPEIVDPVPPPAAAFARVAGAGRILVAAGGDEAPAGFLAHASGALVDGTLSLHVGELDVDPAWQGRGVASALLDALGARAKAEGRGALTLTTYGDVAWNAPFYARRGFRLLASEDWPAICRGERHRMAALGYDTAARVAMVRPV